MDKRIEHFNDRLLYCSFCEKRVLIKHNQVGGVWYLNNWEDAEGNFLFGAYCSECFGVMESAKRRKDYGSD